MRRDIIDQYNRDTNTSHTYCGRSTIILLHQNRKQKVHERQTARMRTRSEWFLGGCGSMELGDDMHLRPPSIAMVMNGGSGNLINMCGGMLANEHGPNGITGNNHNKNANETTSTGIGTYHSHDDLTTTATTSSLHYHRDNYNRLHASSIISSSSINHLNRMHHHVNVNVNHSDFDVIDITDHPSVANSLLSIASYHHSNSNHLHQNAHFNPIHNQYDSNYQHYQLQSSGRHELHAINNISYANYGHGNHQPSARNNNGVMMMVFTVLDFLF